MRKDSLTLLLALPLPALAADYTGIVHARHQLALSVAAPGVVASVPVQPGRRVQAGQVLLQLDDRLQALEEQRRKIVLDDLSELRATEERLKLVQPLAEDARKLQGTKGALSREDLARAELDLLTTRGRLLQLQAQEERERSEHQGAAQERAQRRLVAPVGGVVTKVAIDVGEWARPGDPLVELVDASVLQLRLNVPAAAARALKEGASLEVSFEPALQLAPVQGRVVFVSPAVDAASGLVALRLQFDNPGGRIPPGIKGVIRLSAVPSSGSTPSAREVIETLHALRQAPVDDTWWPLLANNLLRLCRAHAVWLVQEADPDPTPLAHAGAADDPLQPAWRSELDLLLQRARQQGYATCPARSTSGQALWWAAIRLERVAAGWMLIAFADTERPQLNELLLRAQLVADLPGPAPASTAMVPAETNEAATALPQAWAALADVAAQVAGESRFEAAALALVNTLAARCGAQQVVLGWRHAPGARPQVVAISHRDKFERGSAPIARTEDALDEALDFDGGVWLPPPGAQPPLHAAPTHALLQQEQDPPPHLASLPLAAAGRPPRAVLLLAFADAPPPLVQQLLPATLQQLLPWLELLHERERAWPLRMRDRLLKSLQQWLGPGHAGWKAGALVSALLVLYALFAHWDYRVNATGQIATDSTRVLSAQFDGRIDEALVGAGDEVKAGALLARLDQRELRQQEVESRAELKRTVAEADKARAAGALADLEVANARAAQAEARLARVLDLLAQAEARAPFDGIVVEGERKELQGAPVRKGDRLYRLARIEGLYATLVVPERDAAQVQPGASGELVLVSRPDQTIPLRVTAVIPVAQTKGAEGNQFVVRAELLQSPEGWWRPGMSGSARIDAGERQVAWILTHRIVDTVRLWFWW